jgi:hypothetical protein
VSGHERRRATREQPQDEKRAAVTEELHQARRIEAGLAEARRLEEIHLAESSRQDERRGDHDEVAQDPDPAFVHDSPVCRFGCCCGCMTSRI